MHHRRGRDYQAANVGWLWKQQHVYTGGENDSNFTGTRQINKYGDSQAVGLVTDRYRFAWLSMPRFSLPRSRWVMWTRRATASRLGTNTALATPAITFTAHTSLLLTTSVRNGGFGWGATVTNQTSQVSDTFSVDFPTAQTVSLGSTVLTLTNLGTEVAMVKL